MNQRVPGMGNYRVEDKVEEVEKSKNLAHKLVGGFYGASSNSGEEATNGGKGSKCDLVNRVKCVTSSFLRVGEGKNYKNEESSEYCGNAS